MPIQSPPGSPLRVDAGFDARLGRAAPALAGPARAGSPDRARGCTSGAGPLLGRASCSWHFLQVATPGREANAGARRAWRLRRNRKAMPGGSERADGEGLVDVRGSSLEPAARHRQREIGHGRGGSFRA